MSGQLCPQIEHALKTSAGHAVMRAGARAGAWKFAGMSGVRVGLDLDHVVARAARHAPNADVYDLEELACAFEQGALAGMAKRDKQSSGQDKAQDFDLDAFIDGSKPQ